MENKLITQRKRRGNPNWVKGKSANPAGRPKGSYTFYPPLRWHCFCRELIVCLNASEAARRAGYSVKSARFIASRLRRKPAVREILRDFKRKIDGTIKIADGVYLIPDDSRGYHEYRKPEL